MDRFWKLMLLGVALTLPIVVVLIATDNAGILPVLVIWLAVILSFPLIHRIGTRAKTSDAGGAAHDLSATRKRDPHDEIPHIGMDEETPLGDTPEHSEAPERHADPSRGPH